MQTILQQTGIALEPWEIPAALCKSLIDKGVTHGDTFCHSPGASEAQWQAC